MGLLPRPDLFRFVWGGLLFQEVDRTNALEVAVGHPPGLTTAPIVMPAVLVASVRCLGFGGGTK